jgi:lysophospholipase
VNLGAVNFEPAPLLSLPEAPAPAGAQPAWFYGADGVRLRAVLFPATGSARGSVVVSPGRTEPLEKYFEVVEELRGRGFAVLAHDWRGQGASQRLLDDPEKGHARGWRPYISDFDILLSSYEARLPKPWIALGHSLGGGLTTLALEEGEPRFAGAVLSAPMLGLRLGGRPAALVRIMSWFMTFIGRANEYIYPLPKRLAEIANGGALLTHDQARWDRYAAQLEAAPELKLGGVTWGWLAFAMAMTFRIEKLKGIERIQIPVTTVAAQRDYLCSNRPQRVLVARLKHGRYVEARGAFHEILMEQDQIRAVFWNAFDDLAAEVAPARVAAA